MTTVAKLHALLDASRPGLERERRAVRGWPAYLEQRHPRPSVFELFRRRRWQAAFDLATAVAPSSSVDDGVIVPAWVCDTEDDHSNVWTKTAYLFVGDRSGPEALRDIEELDVDDVALLDDAVGDHVLFVRVERGRRRYLGAARGYAPGIETLLRNDDYVVLDGVGTDAFVAVDRCEALPPIPRPTRELPPWHSDVGPAVDLTSLGADLVARLVARFADLRFSPDDDETAAD